MLAVAGDLPTGDGWAYEVKWDGMRVLADVSAGRVRLYSRAGNDASASFPELSGLGEVVEDALLDGEVVAFDDEGRPSFGRLQERMHVRDARRAEQLAGRVPVTYLVFDVLRLYGVDLTAHPWEHRRGVLERIGLAGPSWATPPAFDDGQATQHASAELGLEGVVAKRRESPYRSGSRSAEWVKVAHWATQECLVGGWRVGEGHRGSKTSIGALLVGVRDDAGRLRYAGRVGSGLSERAIGELRRRLDRLQRADSPFSDVVPAVDAAGATWVEPRLVVDVKHMGWTRTGRLRQPTYRGLRPDKSPEEAVRA